MDKSAVDWNLSDAFGGRVTPEELSALLREVDWETFRGKTVRLSGCLPVWGFMMAATHLVGIAQRIEWVAFDGSSVLVWSPSDG